ncbi:growth factor receptor-bound protein 14-like isoform X2 [Belonocnema kinseyi]|uniref:growth factor receptor-bound protein 14-like isoform X2 n=1 Tax=Belonocnema kinseyi TaxID=2817044 RepID=UPI00143DE347|nr:growth factor receptor-bound protein 14-like isoform X2 [Belonocnema kinseyi]XP_033221650.1 growth factor receptor-bound protein 14-like isoform X2 [Belonocnema kinseyi]XP_033221651.1 growth factor receptor-bound protein 14-like isoform X2 [Belonocnema kinseyi]XP_033221652.1 growth factor receptor-bound protein 14-like isoform X2 [Belonocnema kinseyi]
MDYRLMSNNNNYPTHHHWFPKMCSCLDSGGNLPGNRSSGRVGSYKRLGSTSTIYELNSVMHRARRKEEGQLIEEAADHERQEELRFYNDDLSWNTVIVEKNLRTIDLCELLKVKRNATGIAWSIVETWPDLGIERTLEDHEDILAAHREIEMFASYHERKFFFREDYLKYEFFINPKQFFPSEMVAFPHEDDKGTLADAESILRHYLSQEDSECPQVFSAVWMREDGSNTWKKTDMLLFGRKLYTTKKAFLLGAKSLMSRFSSPRSSLNAKSQRSFSPTPSTSGSSSGYSTETSGVVPKWSLDNEQLTTFAHLSDYHVYRIPNSKRYFNAPFEWGICLRPSTNAEAEHTEAGESGLKVIAFHTEKSRACWLTAMRLAKYGKQLRENYRAFKNKQCEQTGGGSPKEYTSYNVPNESIRSRVAMDFTGSVGRIVEDPKEAKDIAESEGVIWKRRWRPFSRRSPGSNTTRMAVDTGIHTTQPWFHGDLKREIAAAIIRDRGSVDGVFLVRESKSNPGSYVLTYKYSDKVFHAQIQPVVQVFDNDRQCVLYTLDKGATKFYDLLQLIEFYQLNAGSLPTRLTHFVNCGVPEPLTRPEDGGASPSPLDGSKRFSTPQKEAKHTNPSII